MIFSYKKIIGLSLIVLIINLMISAIGFFREIIIANYFGTSHILDIYNLGIVFPMVFVGVLSSTIVAVVTSKYINSKNKKIFFWGNLKDLLILNILLFIILSFVIEFCYKYFFISYSNSDLNNIQLVSFLFLPIITFQSISSYFDALLNLENNILKNALSGVLLPLGVIFFLILFKEYNIYSIILGFYFGYTLKLLIQIYLYRKIFLRKDDVSERAYDGYTIRKDFLNLSLSSIILAFMPLITNIYASKFGDGTVSSMNYAYKLIGIGFMLFSSVINSVYFPYISKKFSINKNLALKESLIITFLSMIFVSIFLIPVYFYANEFISIIFERGRFDSNSTDKVANILRSFLWHIPFYIGGLFLSRTILSLEKSKVFIIGNLISIVVLCLFIFVFKSNYFNVGLAFLLVYSISFFYLLFHSLRR